MAPPPSNEQLIEEAKKISKSDPGQAEKLYREVLSKPPGANEAASRDYENALIGLGELYRDYKKQQDLSELIRSSRQTLSSFAKAKTAKLGKKDLHPRHSSRTDYASSSASRSLRRHP